MDDRLSYVMREAKRFSIQTTAMLATNDISACWNSC
jgi:hypothetical protein